MQLSKQERTTFKILAEALEKHGESSANATIKLVALILKGFAEEDN